ncbi:MAG: aminotransferase class V-fold PLP-dependent enzyme [Bacteroidota bacterium]
MLDIQQVRQETPVCLQKIHLNNAGASLQPQVVMQSVLDYLQLEAETGGYETATLKAQEIQGFYTAVAQLLKTKPQNIAYAHHATEAYNKALSSIPFERGDILLTTDDDYASNQIAFLQLQQKLGIQIIRAAQLPEGGVDVNSVEELIKKHCPKLVAVTHIPSNSGLIQDVYSIGRLCQQHDILYLVDACQSVGQLDLDVNEMHCDFLSATGRKYLRGPRGTGFLYVSDKALALHLEPLFLDLGSADWSAPFGYQVAPTARRFEYWENNRANLVGLKTAVEYALQIGLPAIEKRALQLGDYTRRQITQYTDFQVLDRGNHLCSIVTIHHSKYDGAALKKRLVTNNINVSLAVRMSALLDFERKGVEWALRISPHCFNKKEEIDELIQLFNTL